MPSFVEMRLLAQLEVVMRYNVPTFFPKGYGIPESFAVVLPEPALLQSGLYKLMAKMFFYGLLHNLFHRNQAR